LNILVTGGTGFVGQHILKELNKASINVLVISRHKTVTFGSVKTIIGDIGNYDQIHREVVKFNPDTVIHLAWEGIPDFSFNNCQKNLSISIKLFNRLFDSTNCKKVIIAGSCFEYGKKNGPCKEENVSNIESYFTWAKHSLNKYLSVKCAEKNITLNWIRIFYVYGPGQREGSLIPTIIKSISDSKTPDINAPMNKNDFIYVGDVAKIFRKVSQKNLPSGIYNLGSGNPTSVYQICQIVERKILGTETISKNIYTNRQKNESVNFWADMKKTEQLLKINDYTSIEEGVNYHIESLQSG